MISKLNINGVEIIDLKPLKIKNKNQKFSAKGYLNNKLVKIYEVFDPKQGQLREFVSKNKNLKKYFPKLILYNHNYIVEEWISGPTLKEINKDLNLHTSNSNEVKNIIKIMWSIKYNDEVFDYLNYIYSRVNKTCHLDLSCIPKRINHNDLSLDNIVMSQDGLKIIDNEFLGCNNGWILNIKNSFIKEDFVYQNFLEEDTINELWDTRKEWSKINLSFLKKIKLFFKTLI